MRVTIGRGPPAPDDPQWMPVLGSCPATGKPGRSTLWVLPEPLQRPTRKRCLMSVDALSAFVTTPEFFSGLVTGALVSKTVRRAVGTFVEDRIPGGDAE